MPRWLIRIRAGCLLLCAFHGSANGATLGGPGYEWDGRHFAVPLEIRDNSGVARRAWPVRSGVPLPEGVVQRTTELRLTDDDGREIPAQFTELSRYRAPGGSLRWVLLDLEIDLPAHGRRQVWLRNDKPAAAVTNPIRITESDTGIRVTSGALVAEIATRTGHLFESVSIDGQPVITASRNDGPVLRSGEVASWEHFEGRRWNNAGWEKKRSPIEKFVAETEYFAGPFRPRHVEIESRGPLHAVIAIHNRHLPIASGAGVVETGIYDTTTRLHFFRDKSFVIVEHTFAHADRTQPQWQYMFRAAGLRHSLTLKSPVDITVGDEAGVARDRLAGRFALPANQTSLLYQHGRDGAGKVPYTLGIGLPGLEVDAAVGERSRFIDVSDADKGLAVAIRNAWREGPRALRVSATAAELWLHADAPAGAAADDRPAYDLDFGERSSHEALLYFHPGDADKAQVGAIAEAFEYPLFARAIPSWVSDCEVWPFEIGRAVFETSPAEDPHWEARGNAWNHQSGRASYNSGGHHDSLSSSWLPFMRAGSLTDFERLRAESLWSILRNPGWAYRDADIDAATTNAGDTSPDDYLDEWDKVAGFGPKDFYLWRHQDSQGARRGGTSYLNGYKVLPDAEHYALFQLFEYWHLTGDRRALPALQGFENWALNYQHKHLFQRNSRPLTDTRLFENDPDAMRRGHYSRIYAWMLYATLAGYQATGSARYDYFTLWQLRRMLALLRNRHGQMTRWDARPSDFFPSLRRWDRIAKLDALFENREFANWDSRVRQAISLFETLPPVQSRAKTWMEAKAIFALHEAYRAYGDERILDGIWALADYFSHHVLFYPRLAMVNQFVSMPGERLGFAADSLYPQRHDRMTQAWPLLYHYTGWAETFERYAAFDRARQQSFVQDRFLQTYAWEQQNRRKLTRKAPSAVTDLAVTRASRAGIALRWTSPSDDGADGRAERYFVKVSDRPIREFAPTDHPARIPEKARIVAAVEQEVFSRRRRNPKAGYYANVEVEPEILASPLADPDWDRVVAFWMAEHVAGEPVPGPAGSPEEFVIRTLLPHQWLGAPEQPGLEWLESGRTYYVALCSWDGDRNLSRLSNVVSFVLR